MGHPEASEGRKKTNALTLADANAALDVMKRTGCIGGQGPYILDIPQDSQLEYHHKNDFQRFQYTYNTPFTPDEWENLQWQTFVYYEPGNEEYKMYTQHVHQTDGQSHTPSTSNDLAPKGKKKISLSAWKNRQQTVSAPGTPTSADQGKSVNPIERIRKEETADAAVQDSSASAEGGGGSESKRKRVDSTQDTDDADREDGELDDTPASKRSRLDTAISTQDMVGGDLTMPDKLSPLNNRNADDDLFPPRLSSRLPQNILDAIAERKGTSGSEHRPMARRNNDAILTANGSNTKHAFRDLNSSHPGPTSGSGGTQGEPEKQKSLKAPEQDGQHTPKDAKPKADIQDTPSKRRAAQASGDTAAREKVTRPVTPVTTTLSPETSRALTGTPSLRKGIAMTRVQSLGGTTPGDSGTPQSTGADRTPGKTSAAVKNATQQAWDAQKLRLDAIARKLKHESQDFKNGKSPSAHLAAALKAVECLITYMVSFSCIDYSASSAEPRAARPFRVWTDLKELFRYLRSVCMSISPLNGIAAMLTFSYASHMLDVMESAPKAHDKDVLLEYLQLQKRASKDVDELLNISVLVEQFPKTWKEAQQGKTDDAVPAIEELLSGGFPLPVTTLTPPVQAARAARALVTEWLRRSKTAHKLTDISTD